MAISRGGRKMAVVVKVSVTHLSSGGSITHLAGAGERLSSWCAQTVFLFSRTLFVPLTLLLTLPLNPDISLSLDLALPLNFSHSFFLFLPLSLMAKVS